MQKDFINVLILINDKACKNRIISLLKKHPKFDFNFLKSSKRTMHLDRLADILIIENETFDPSSVTAYHPSILVIFDHINDLRIENFIDENVCDCLIKEDLDDKTLSLSVTRAYNLSKIKRRLSDSSKQVMLAQEAERKRVSRELHDGVNQLLSSARFRINSINEKIGTKNQNLSGEIESASELIGTAINEVRRISRNLRPTSLDDLGLFDAIKGMCSDFQDRTKILVSFTYSRKIKELSDNSTVTIFRIIQEALNNVEKHSKADSVRVNIRLKDSQVWATIEDDGIGFVVPKIIMARLNGTGQGLVNIQERVQMAGGFVNIKSAPKSGTKIFINLPIDIDHGQMAIRWNYETNKTTNS